MLKSRSTKLGLVVLGAIMLVGSACQANEVQAFNQVMGSNLSVDEATQACGLVDARAGAGACEGLAIRMMASKLNPTDPRTLGQQMAAARGWTGVEWQALDVLWGKLESGWNPNNVNRSSGACGIPQALPCSKIADRSVRGQIQWGLDYIAGRYGTPSRALAHHRVHHWY